MITLGDKELFPRRVRLFGALLRAIEDARNRQHRDDREDLGGAAHLDRRDEHLGQSRVHREMRHLATEFRQLAGVVESAENPELVHRVEDIFLRRHGFSGRAARARCTGMNAPGEEDP